MIETPKYSTIAMRCAWKLGQTIKKVLIFSTWCFGTRLSQTAFLRFGLQWLPLDNFDFTWLGFTELRLSESWSAGNYRTCGLAGLGFGAWIGHLLYTFTTTILWDYDLPNSDFPSFGRPEITVHTDLPDSDLVLKTVNLLDFVLLLSPRYNSLIDRLLLLLYRCFYLPKTIYHR